MFQRRRKQRSVPVSNERVAGEVPDESSVNPLSLPPINPGRGMTLPVLPDPPVFRGGSRISEVRALLAETVDQEVIEPINWRLIKDFHPEFAKAMKAVVWSVYNIAEDTDDLRKSRPDMVCKMHDDFRLLIVKLEQLIPLVDPKRSAYEIFGKKRVIRWGIFISLLTGLVVALLPSPTIIWGWIASLFF